MAIGGIGGIIGGHGPATTRLVSNLVVPGDSTGTLHTLDTLARLRHTEGREEVSFNAKMLQVYMGLYNPFVFTAHFNLESS